MHFIHQKTLPAGIPKPQSKEGKRDKESITKSMHSVARRGLRSKHLPVPVSFTLSSSLFSSILATASSTPQPAPAVAAFVVDNELPTTIVNSPDTIARALEILYDVNKSASSSGSLGSGTRYHACDTEVCDIDLKRVGPVGNGKVTCASIYSGPDVDFGAGPGGVLWIDNLDEAGGTLDQFKEFFADEDQKKVWHNYSFDRAVLFNHQIDTKGFGGDTMHMARLWDSSRQSYSLASLTADYLDSKFQKAAMKSIFGRPELKKDGTEGKKIGMAPIEELQRMPETRNNFIKYSALDAMATWQLHSVMETNLRAMKWAKGKSMLDFYQKYLVSFGEMLTDMERVGVPVAYQTYLPQIEVMALNDHEEHKEKFMTWCERVSPGASRMNPASDPQKQALLFGGGSNRNVKTNDPMPSERVFKVLNIEGVVEEGKTKPLKNCDLVIHGLGLNPVKHTKAGWPAVSAEVLRELAGKNPTNVAEPQYGTAYKALGGGAYGREACIALDSLCAMNSIDTMVANFIKPLQSLSDDQGRVHCSLNLNTETGRLSSRRPNLQNQPALEKDKYKIRDAFRASEGKTLIVADYGQLELRLLAHITECQSMVEAFKSGGDFHSRTAMGMYPYVADAVKSGAVLLEAGASSAGGKKIPLLKDVYATERRKAKVLNFSIAYGKTAHGLSKDWNVTVKEAKQEIDAWYNDRPEVLEWQKNTIQRANELGYTRTLMGRYRMLPDAQSKNRSKRGHAERAAINTPIQGSAADVMMMAMLKLHRDERLKELGWEVILQIHDEVICEGPEESADEAMQIVVGTMERPFEMPLRVKLEVDAKSDISWFLAK